MRADPAPPLAARLTEVIRLDLAANPVAVRAGLETVLDALAQAGFSEDDRALAEILLAEVLNNVVEHAYCGAGGRIELTAAAGPAPGTLAGTLAGRTLWFTVYDWGLQMPPGVVPGADLPPIAAADLPEGGFGWHLIRALAACLDHGREGGRNWLRFSLAPEQRPAGW